MASGGKQGGQPAGSMHEGLQAILGQLGTLMVAQDADVNFLTQLQHVIVGKIKQSTQHAMAPGSGGPGGGGNSIAPGGGAGMTGLQSGGAAGMGGPSAGPPPGSAGPGGPGGMGAPNPDELRRVLGANGQTG